MLVFGFLTIRHVRQGKMRVANRNTVNYRQQILRSVDRQLIQMMLVQSFVFSMTTCGPSIVNFYFISNVNLTTDPVEAARELLITTTFGFIGLFGPCTSFYLFTLSSKLFRRELKQLFHRQQ
jgi:phosphatidylinositol kinase/protein kinase (PI-3  family)